MTSDLLEEYTPNQEEVPHKPMSEPGSAPLGPITPATAVGSGAQPSIAGRVIGGTSALTLGTMIERGCGFLANILAARFAGGSTFGAYSFAISTANQISTYAAGGIGATAARFSGKYPRGTAGYGTLAFSLAIVSLVSAAVAVSVLWFGASPLAYLLHKPEFSRLLRWAAMSATGMLLLECARGFFVGQRRLAAIVVLSLVVGIGMITLLPAAARAHNPIRMIASQGAVTCSAVAICLLLSGPLSLRAPYDGGTLPLTPMLREVFGFGLVQLAGLVGSNLAGWWLTFLVARSDPSMVQMGFFGIASQMRNIVGIAPSLLTEGSYAVMADPGGEKSRTPRRVMALCSFASLALALTLASLGIVLVPWLLTLVYGRSYQAAGVTVAIALAIAVVHMGNAPAAARLTIVSIQATGVINTVWAGFVIIAAGVLAHGAGAGQAMAIYFVAHVLSSCLVLLTLSRKDFLPTGMISLFLFSTVSVTALTGLAYVRSVRPELTTQLTAVMFVILVLAVTGLLLFGNHFRWLPSRGAVDGLAHRFSSRFLRSTHHV